MNIYDLSRKFWDFAFENPDKIKPNHGAMYFFAIEHCNRLGWKERFGFPTVMAMEAIGIKSYNTFINTLKELVEFGFIEMIEKSKNQYSANIIALSNFNEALNKAYTKAPDKALDKALIKHGIKQGESTEQSNSKSIDSIDKQIYNTTNLPVNNIDSDFSSKKDDTVLFPEEKIETSKKTRVSKEKSSDKKESPEPEKPKAKIFFFKQAMIDYGFNPGLIDHFILVRKKKRLVNTEVAFNIFIREIEKTEKDKNEVFEIIVKKQWGGFEASWYKKLEDEQSSSKTNNGTFNGGKQNDKINGRSNQFTVDDFTDPSGNT